MLKRIISVVLCMAMVLSIPAVLPAGTDAASGGNLNAVRSVQYINPSISAQIGEDGADTCIFDESVFSGDSYKYNQSLAAMSLQLGMASLSSAREEGEFNSIRNLRAYLTDNGFVDFKTNTDYRTAPDEETSAVACAHKKYTSGGKTYTLMVVVLRGGTIGKEWYSNLRMGRDPEDKGDHAGYRANADKALAFVKQYAADKEISGDVKLWLAGYSRGAGIGNLMGADIARDADTFFGSKVRLSRRNFYCYLIGTPMTAAPGSDNNADIYGCIHNLSDEVDLVTYFPGQNTLTRYGVIHQYIDQEHKDEMLGFLKMMSESYCDIYINSADPDGFTPMVMDMNALKEGKLKMDPDPDSYLPKDIASYNESVAETMADLFAEASESGRDSRAGYVSEYQEPLSEYMEIFGTKLIKGEMGDYLQYVGESKAVMPLAISMYITFMVDKYKDNRSNELNSAIESAFNELASYIENEDGSLRDEYLIPSWPGKDNYNIRNKESVSKYYTKLREALFTRTDGSEGKLYALSKPVMKADRSILVKALRGLTAVLFSSVVGDTASKAGASATVISRLTDLQNCYAVSWIMTRLMMDNVYQSDKIEPFRMDNEQFKQMATMAGNGVSLAAMHVYKFVICWLKAYDPNFEGVGLQTDAQQAGYRRVYISHPSKAKISGKVMNADGKVIAKFVNSSITSSSDPWIGITTCDSGDWLRLPVENTYYVSVTFDKKCSIDLKLSEYSVYDGREARSVKRDDNRIWTGITMKPGRTLTLKVTRIGKHSGKYIFPSNVYYSTSIKDTALKVSKTSVTLSRGGKYRINAKVVNASGGSTISSQTKKITYASSSSKVASVSSKGVITARKKGSCTITVSAPGGLKRKIRVTVK